MLKIFCNEIYITYKEELDLYSRLLKFPNTRVIYTKYFLIFSLPNSLTLPCDNHCLCACATNVATSVGCPTAWQTSRIVLNWTPKQIQNINATNFNALVAALSHPRHKDLADQSMDRWIWLLICCCYCCLWCWVRAVALWLDVV